MNGLFEQAVEITRAHAASVLNAEPTIEQLHSLPDWAQRYIDKLNDDVSTERNAKEEALQDRDELRGELADLRRRRH